MIITCPFNLLFLSYYVPSWALHTAISATDNNVISEKVWTTINWSKNYFSFTKIRKPNKQKRLYRTKHLKQKNNERIGHFFATISITRKRTWPYISFVDFKKNKGRWFLFRKLISMISSSSSRCLCCKSLYELCLPYVL